MRIRNKNKKRQREGGTKKPEKNQATTMMPIRTKMIKDETNAIGVVKPDKIILGLVHSLRVVWVVILLVSIKNMF